MTSSEERKEGIMTMVMRLLELANHPDTPPHEALLAEQKAESIMAKHMIDRFEAEQAAKRRGESTRKPIQEEWEIAMSAYKTDDGAGQEFDHQIISLMEAVLEHCNIRVNRTYGYAKVVINKGTDHERLTQDTTRRIYKIVGYAEDIAYAERIWFNVFRTFVSNVNPSWDPNESLEYNAYNFASAGVSWKQQVLLAEAANDTRLEWPWREQGDDKKAPFYSSWNAGALIDPGNEPWGRSIHKLKRACKKYCTDEGVEYPYAGGVKLRVATRNSFARSYKSTIATRLEEIRRVAKQQEDAVSSGKFAIALLDTKEQVDAEFYRLFPQYDPEVQAKKRQEEEWRLAALWASLTPKEQQEVLKQARAEEERWLRDSQRARRNYRTVRDDPTTRTDSAAWARGKRAAESVNLRNDAEVKKDKRKEIS